MNCDSIRPGSWQRSEDDGWIRLLRFPLAARLHIPAADGRVVCGLTFPKNSPPWVGWMRVSCIAVEIEGSAFQISLRDTVKAFFHARLERKNDELWLTLTWRPASYSSRETSAGPPKLLLQEHKTVQEVWQGFRKWMDEKWPRQPTCTPDWITKIPCAVYVELWRGSGTITHTFKELTSLLTAMHDAGIPENALLYFWGFHAPFDTAYPDYRPAKELGGEYELTGLVEAAYRFGYRLMPHLNYWGCDARLSLYEKFQKEQVRDRNGVL